MKLRSSTLLLVPVILLVLVRAPGAHAAIGPPVISEVVSVTSESVTVTITQAPSVDGTDNFSTYMFQTGNFIYRSTLGVSDLSSTTVRLSTEYFVKETDSYSVRVRGMGSLKSTGQTVTGSDSNIISVRLRATPPTAVSVAPKAGDPTALTVSFTAPTSVISSGVVGYEYSLNDGATWVNSGATGAATGFEIGGLASAQIATVRIRAVNGGYKGEESTPAITVRNGVPEAPLDVAAAGSITDGSVDLTWTHPSSYVSSAVTGFEYSVDDGSWTGGIAASATGATIVGLVDGRRTSIRVRAVNPSGAGVASTALVLNAPAPSASPPASSGGGSGGGGGSSGGGAGGGSGASGEAGGSAGGAASSAAASAPEPAAPQPTSSEPQSSMTDVAGISPAQMKALTPEQFGEMSTAALGALSPTQARSLDPGQLRLLRDDQIAALEPEVIRALRPETLRTLTVLQVRSLTQEQIGALRPKQIRALGPTKRRFVLERRQVG